MAALLFVFLLFFLLLPFLAAVFVASGLLLLVRPEGLRPPWWDWGMDDSEHVAKADAVPEVVTEAAIIEAETPRVLEVEVAAKAARPRW